MAEFSGSFGGSGSFSRTFPQTTCFFTMTFVGTITLNVTINRQPGHVAEPREFGFVVRAAGCLSAVQFVALVFTEHSQCPAGGCQLPYPLLIKRPWRANANAGISRWSVQRMGSSSVPKGVSILVRSL